jgi:hypothetical protein
MPEVFIELRGIERDTAQQGMSTGQDISGIANEVGRVCDPALDSIRDEQKPDEHVLTLECRSCGARWSSVPEPGGEFRQGFWLCPRGCDW